MSFILVPDARMTVKNGGSPQIRTARRRPLFYRASRVTDGRGESDPVWRTVQGSNLRHLAVLRDSVPLPCLSANRPDCHEWRKAIESNDRPCGRAGFRDQMRATRPAFRMLSSCVASVRARSQPDGVASGHCCDGCELEESRSLDAAALDRAAARQERRDEQRRYRLLTEMCATIIMTGWIAGDCGLPMAHGRALARRLRGGCSAAC